MRILVVEDDFASRNVMTRFLEPMGEVTAAENGVKGLAAFTAAAEAGHPFDLVALDVMMPEMNGYEMLQRLREFEAQRQVPHANRTRVLMTTALDDLTSVSTAFGFLCDEYLVKPVRRATLREKLQGLGFELPTQR